MNATHRFAGIPRMELERRLALAENEIDRLRNETTALSVGSLFTRWSCSGCSRINTFASVCEGCGRDAPTEPLMVTIDERGRLHQILVRLVTEHLRSRLGREFSLANGTGDARSIANRERARLDFDHALLDRGLTWRHVLVKVVWDALAEVQVEKLAAALVQASVVITRWLDVLEDEWAERTQP